LLTAHSSSTCHVPTFRYTSSTLICYFTSHATATPAIYALSLHAALPIWTRRRSRRLRRRLRHAPSFRPSRTWTTQLPRRRCPLIDRKSTRLNSSHVKISYAVFCLKKKTK